MTVVSPSRRTARTGRAASTASTAGTAASSGSREGSFPSDYFVGRRGSSPRRSPRQTGVLGQLNLEWSTALGSRPVPAAWTRCAVLAGFGTGQDVLDAISRADASQDVDAILHALLTFHGAGDQMAGRTVLQTMLGKVARTAQTARNRGLADECEAALAAMWTAIHTYPLRRTRSVAGNLALDALRQLGERTPSETAVPQVWLTEAEEAQHSVVGPAAPTEDGFDTVLVQTLIWATDHQVLTPAEIQLIAQAHLQTSGGFVARMTDLAEEMGLTFRCLQQRHHRAVTRLAGAVAEAMWTPGEAGPVSSTSSVLVASSSPA